MTRGKRKPAHGLPAGRGARLFSAHEDGRAGDGSLGGGEQGVGLNDRGLHVWRPNHGVSERFDEKPKARRRAKSLLEKMAGLAGADQLRSLPRDASARYKRLLNTKPSAIHSR